MAKYYTRGEWIEMAQAQGGTKTGTDNKRFPPDKVWDIIMRTVHGWMPWLPADMQDSATESIYRTNPEYDNGAHGYVYILPETCARVVGVDIVGATEAHIEIYGVGKKAEDGTELDYNAYVDRKQRLRRVNLGIRLFCKVGGKLLTYPDVTSSPYIDVTYRPYVAEPLSDTAPLNVPKVAVPFLLTMVAADIKKGDLRESASGAFWSEAISTLKTVFGIKDREGN